MDWYPFPNSTRRRQRANDSKRFVYIYDFNFNTGERLYAPYDVTVQSLKTPNYTEGLVYMIEKIR